MSYGTLHAPPYCVLQWKLSSVVPALRTDARMGRLAKPRFPRQTRANSLASDACNAEASSNLCDQLQAPPAELRNLLRRGGSFPRAVGRGSVNPRSRESGRHE